LEAEEVAARRGAIKPGKNPQKGQAPAETDAPLAK
jgi:hypothetical protein